MAESTITIKNDRMNREYNKINQFYTEKELQQLRKKYNEKLP